ncbi:signal transduction histidine kinase [Paenibacillus endophyticus]|uniref:histidine kinase n=1 Tax=Paenibacillus endophyticus TaxID=1294268 RepID=A0A7W5G8T8_9BACL|nr:ATP-binding protein [Paenibacillus endophyticus]MBB3150252.1 signal transduction histidine kinase [Paenibacillus endophyticus]
MKDNIALKLVFRSILNLIVSASLAFITVFFFIFAGMYLVDRISVVRDISRNLISIFTEAILFGGTGIVLFFLYFFMLQWQMFRNLSQMNQTVRGIAEGRYELDYQIEVSKSSLFSPMASNINNLVGRLHHALDDERKAEQTKNELITNVSHDLRTPLTSVLGYLGLIEQDRYRDEVELRHYVQIAYDKSQRLNVLINDLFEYTRMRHDTSGLKLTTFNLIEMLGQLLVQFRLPLQEAGMQSRLVSDKASVMLEGDPAKLVRVFENLISNAINYGKEGKQIIVKASAEDGAAIVEVINFGEPISSVDLPYLFDRFYRVDKSRTQWAGGSGLGLAIAKGIIQKHGGMISVSSDLEQTSFRVALPIIH